MRSLCFGHNVSWIVMILGAHIALGADGPEAASKPNPTTSSAPGNPPRLPGDEPAFREWNSADGKFKTEARLIGERGGSLVLFKPSGVTIEAPREKMSEGDLAYAGRRLPQIAQRRLLWGAAPSSSAPDLTASVADEAERLTRRPEASVFSKIAELDGPGSPFAHVRLDGAGRVALTISEDGTCRTWDIGSRKLLGELSKKLPGTTFCGAISHDGQIAVVGGAAKQLIAFNASTGEILHSFDKLDSPPTHIKICSENNRIVYVTQNSDLGIVPILGGLGSIYRYGDTGPITVADIGIAPDGQTAFVAQEPIEKGFILLDKTEQDGFKQFDMNRQGFKALSVGTSPGWYAMGTNLSKVVCEHILAPGKLRPFAQQSRFPNAACVSFSDDGKFLLCMNKAGAVDIMPMAHMYNSTGYRIPVVAKDLSASGDARTVAYVEQSGKISIWRIPKCPETIRANLYRAFHDHLVAGRHERLEQLVETIDKQELQADEWPNKNSRMLTIVELLSEQDFHFFTREEHERQLDNWVSKRPNSPLAKLARAHSQILQAWGARGEGTANSVTPDGASEFATRMEKARALLQPIADGPNPPAVCYPLLFEVGKSQGWKADVVDRYVAQLMKTDPQFVNPHVNVAMMRLPRWGGGPRDSEKYAREIADKIGGDAGDAMYTLIANELVWYHGPVVFFQATGFDRQRMTRGAESLVKSQPENSRTMNKLVFVAYTLQDSDLARRAVHALGPRKHNWPKDAWKSVESGAGVMAWAVSLANAP